jgi:hypothetical protein
MTRFSRYQIAMFAGVLAALIGLSVGYDAWIEKVSTTRGTLTGRHAKCGPVVGSGPKEPQGFRSLKRYKLMARLEDGRLLTVTRHPDELPACGATLTIAERVTPWGTVWYWTE